MTVANVSVNEVHELCEKSSEIILLDVRETNEFEEVSSPCAKNYPLSKLDVSQIAEELEFQKEKQKPLYIICRSGVRSLKAAAEFLNAGYTEIYNVEGGMNSWIEHGLPVNR